MSTELDSFNAITLLWLCWRIVGIYPFSRLKWLYNTYAILANLAFSVISPIFILMMLFHYNDIVSIMHSMQASPTLIISTMKNIAYFLNISRLQSLTPYLYKLDQRALRNKEDVLYMRKVIKQCRLITFIILVIFVMSLMSFAIPGIIKRQLLFEAWYPFDWNQYYLQMYTFQFLATSFQIVQNWGNDSFPPVSIHLLRGQIHVLCMRVSRIGKDPNMTEEENYQELKACSRDHQDIICIFEIIRPILSQATFLQFVITAFVWCATMAHYLLFNRQISQLFSTLVYMAAIISELFPMCYASDALKTEADGLTTAIYSCNWLDQSVKFRKTLIIFMQNSQKTITLKAGGLFTISLQTMLSIFRFSFSVYTLMSRIQ